MRIIQKTKIQKIENKCKFLQSLAKVQDIIIFKTISLSQETIQYSVFKSEIASVAHKDP